MLLIIPTHYPGLYCLYLIIGWCQNMLCCKWPLLAQWLVYTIALHPSTCSQSSLWTIAYIISFSGLAIIQVMLSDRMASWSCLTSSVSLSPVFLVPTLLVHETCTYLTCQLKPLEIFLFHLKIHSRNELVVLPVIYQATLLFLFLCFLLAVFFLDNSSR